MNGADLRKVIHGEGIFLWEVAREYGCADTTFSKKLRSDFSPEDTKRILGIIEELKAEKEQKK